MYSKAHFCGKHHLSFLAWIIRAIMRWLFSCDIPYKAEIGKHTRFPHYALGVVIHKEAVIGNDCVIEQNVTIGGRSGIMSVPRIGDHVLIGAGAAILGPVIIGDYAKIGAGAVVLKDVPAYATAVGVPARIIEKCNPVQ